MSVQKVKIKIFELILGALDGGLLACSCNCLTEIRFSLISSHTITIAAFVPEYLTYFCISQANLVSSFCRALKWLFIFRILLETKARIVNIIFGCLPKGWTCCRILLRSYVPSNESSEETSGQLF